MNGKLTTSGSSYPARLEKSKDLADIFEVVKDAVEAQLGLSRGGLMLGIAELGGRPDSWIGGFYPVATNIIVMNRGPMNRILREQPELYKSYCFHILLHEYIHTVGYMDEALTRRRALEISDRLFGKDHLATKMAADIGQFFPYLTYALPQEPPEDLDMELVRGFDRSCASYIC
ncbi:MAG: hypothetical protein ISF22_05020 [Methanomassiliicoccus sp.]|nr:hypothetical protein [Methanomassiliicoccus sp.]